MRRRVISLLVVLLAVAGAIAWRVRGSSLPWHRPAPNSPSVWDWEDWDKAEALISVATEEGLPTLHRAAGRGDVAEVTGLLRQGTDVNARDKDGWTALHWAAFEGHTDVVELLLQKGALPDAKAYDINGSGVRFNSDCLPRGTPAQWRKAHKREKGTPLKAALAKGRKEAAEVLLAHEPPGMRTEDLLFWAVGNGYRGGAEVLLGKGASTSARDKEGWTPLHWAARRGDGAMVSLLLDHGADVNARTRKAKGLLYLPVGVLDTPRGTTPLHLATQNGVASLLLSRGAAADAQDADGNTALHLAANGSDLQTAKALLAGKADPNVRNSAGETPLHKAVVFIEPEMTVFLLQRGASVNLSDYQGRSPLHRAAELGNVDEVRVLLARGASATARDAAGRTPLALALAENQREVAVLLRSEDTGARRAYPLHEAAARGDSSQMERLLRQGARINGRDDSGLTPLHVTVAAHHLEAVRFLLERGADVRARDNEAWTPLHKAALDGQLEMVRLLLASGADVNAMADDGDRPLHLAVQEGRFAVAELLLAKGAEPNAVGRDATRPADRAFDLAADDGGESVDKMLALLKRHGGTPRY